MKKIFVREINLSRFKLEYYIIENQINTVNGGLYFHSYGIEIIKKEGDVIETKAILNVVYSEESAKKITEKLANNKVTPITMEEIIDDYINNIPHKFNLKRA